MPPLRASVTVPPGSSTARVDDTDSAHLATVSPVSPFGEALVNDARRIEAGTVATVVATSAPDSATAQRTADGDVADDRTALARQIDTLSLGQALLDFELANARVLDLTARLVEANGRVVKMHGERDGARAQVDEARTDAERARLDAASAHAAMAALRASRTFRLAQRIQAVVHAVRR